MFIYYKNESQKTVLFDGSSRTVQNMHLHILLQLYDLQNKSMDWFLHDRSLRHERVKGPLREKIYRSYKIFDIENFNTPLQASLDVAIYNTYSEFKSCYVLYSRETLKIKMLRQRIKKINDNKIKIKSIATTEHVKTSEVINKSQRNFCVKILRKTKKQHYRNLNI